MKTTYILALCVAMAAVGTSCSHKDTPEEESTVGRLNVTFDWTNAPDANPESMSLYLYPKNGGTAQRYEFANKVGGVIEVPVGEYTAVCVNSDTRNLVLNQPDNTTYSTSDNYKYFKITSTSAALTESLSTLSSTSAADAPRATGAESESVVSTPEAFWTDTKTDISVKSLTTNDTQTVKMTPSVGYCTYTVQLKNIANVDRVREMSATLSGMAGGIYAAQLIPTSDAVTFPFAVSVNSTSATAQGVFNTFGHCPTGTSHQHSVVIYAVMTDGSIYYQTADVTDQVNNAANQSNVVITIDGVNLPAADTSSTSNGVIDVEKWEIVNVDILF